MNRMLDLGAGAGLIGLAIVAAHPTMTGVILDRPEIVAVAQRFIREYELQDRVTTIGGDYYTDDIGAGYDLVWTSYAIDRDRVDQAIGRIFAALNPAGVHINVSEGLTDERTRPARMVNMMLAHTLGGSDAALDEGEIAQAMFRAGFRSVHTRSMCGYLHSPAVVDVARK